MVPSEELRTIVIKTLRDIQILGGRPDRPISGPTMPISDLPDFDSQNGLEFSCAIEVATGCTVPLDENLCVDDSGPRRPRTVDEIAERLSELIPTDINS